ncbi:hypothetical protein GZ77_13570 [Endozoicomonas montiporae]|uniref:Uncharacterized protein n=2 Tax=Endozoicomonas montiporae TaxID=1027273 RepID=A0A081N4N5_9GAMM|nr:hypothetical protein [Endozoicomonas montiporae]AMO57712.1 hypothetical protein EZMO1_3760 [Endozoicomonas montiporae CL-33]KEQ13408.1 hypothetical protein GZ77_13570 [Endozoicomonas montiporae]
MDAPGPSKSNPQPELPDPQNPEGSAGEAEKKQATNREGRTVSEEEARSVIAEAEEMAGTDTRRLQQAVAKRKTDVSLIKAGNDLDDSVKQIKDFIKINQLDESFSIEYDPVNGFSSETHLKFVVMSQLKDLIDHHIALLDQVYEVISPSSQRQKQINKAVRKTAGKRKQTSEEKALVTSLSQAPGLGERKNKYWKERGYIRLYSAFCKQRFGAVALQPPVLERLGDPKLFIPRAEEFIAQTLEWMGVLSEVMQCGIAQGDNKELRECVKEFDAAGESVAVMIQSSEPLYMVDEKRDELRKILAEDGQYLEHWLEVLSGNELKELKASDSPKLINAIVAAIILDKPDIALRLLQTFSDLVKSEEVPAKDCFSLCMSLISTMTWLYDRAEPLGEHRERIESAEKVVKAFEELIGHIDENRLLSEQDRASLLYLYSGIDRHCSSEVQHLKDLEQRVIDRGNELIREEELQKQKIQAKLEKRERRRQKRIAEQQPVSVSSAKVASESPEVHQTGEEKADVKLNACLKKALEAFARNEPNRVIKAIFAEVVQDQNASTFDKAQAHYGYADILSIRLAPLLEKMNELVNATYQYEQILGNNEVPPPDDEFRFNHVLRKLKGEAESINWAVLEIAQSIKSALDVFYELGDDQSEFLEQLLELHDLADDLVDKAGRVSRCCERLPQIYQLRGRVLRQYLAQREESGGSRDTEVKERRKARSKVIQTNIDWIKGFSSKLNGSIHFIRSILDRQTVESSVQAASPQNVSQQGSLQQSSLQQSSPQQTSDSQPAKVPIAQPVTKPPRRVHFVEENILGILPDFLKDELRHASGSADIVSRIGAPAEQAQTLPIEAFAPASSIDPHPLTQVARNLGRSLMVNHKGKQWLVTLSRKPTEFTGGAIPKGTLRVNLDIPDSAQTQPVSQPDITKASTSASASKPDVTEAPTSTSDRQPVESPDMSEDGSEVLKSPVTDGLPALNNPPLEFKLSELSVETQPESLAASSSTKQPVESGDSFIIGAADSTYEPIVAPEPAEAPQAFEFPVGFFISEDLFSSLEYSLGGTRQSWRMGNAGLTASTHEDSASLEAAKPQSAQKSKSRKKSKGKKQRAPVREKVKEKVKEKKALPDATGQLMQLRVRDYLKVLISTGKKPDGSALPARFDLDGVKARIQNGTFLATPKALQDFAILADALAMPVRLTAAATDVYNCKPGMGKPVEIAMNANPDEPYMSLEYFSFKNERCWFASLPHFFEYQEEETVKQLEESSK